KHAAARRLVDRRCRHRRPRPRPERGPLADRDLGEHHRGQRRPGYRQARQRGGLRGDVRPRQLGAGGLDRPLGPNRRNPPAGHHADRRPRAGSRRDALVRPRGPTVRRRRHVQRDADLRSGRVRADCLRPAVHHGPSEQHLDLHRYRGRRRGDYRDHRNLPAAFPPRTRAPSASLTQRLFRGPRGSPAVFVTHELLRRETVEERAYQVNIARACLERSTLVVLPTGIGKTVIAAMVIAEVLRRRGGRILFLAPTKPLVEQHAASMRKVLVVDRITLFTGEATAPEDRELLWRENKIIVSTPQVIRNDVRAERISLDDVSLIVFDEAHRAVGDYAYVDVAAAYKEVPDRLV